LLPLETPVAAAVKQPEAAMLWMDTLPTSWYSTSPVVLIARELAALGAAVSVTGPAARTPRKLPRTAPSGVWVTPPAVDCRRTEPPAPVSMPEPGTPAVPRVSVPVSLHSVTGPPLVATPVTVVPKPPDAVTWPVAKPTPLRNATDAPGASVL